MLSGRGLFWKSGEMLETNCWDCARTHFEPGGTRCILGLFFSPQSR